MIQLKANKSFQKKHKASEDSILDLTGNPNDDLPNVDNNDNATLDDDAPKRPMGSKKAKQLLRKGGGDACIEAFDQMWEKRRLMHTKKQTRRKGLTKH
jgi:hypothetical protein